MLFSVNKSLIISFFLLLCFFAFLIFLGEDASIRVHDNLEANIAWYKSLADQHLLLASSYTPNETVMQAPRIAFGSELSLIAWLFVWFKPIIAYNINVVLMSLIAFIGTYLFTKDSLKLSPKIAPLVALAFALLPFWFSGGQSAAGQPLLFWSFDRILKKHHSLLEWTIFLLFPFYSSLIIAGLFMMVLMVAYLGLKFLTNDKRIAYKEGIFALVILTVGYVLVEYRLFLDILKIGTPTGFTPHRLEFIQGNSFSESLKAAKNSFLGGQNHFPSIHTYLILPAAFLYSIYAFFKRKTLATILLCLLILAGIALIDGFWTYEGFETFKDSIPILKAIQLDRFYSLYPILWFSIFALIIREIPIKFALVLGAAQVILVLFSNQVFGDFIKKNIHGRDYVSYREFYAESLFSRVKAVLQNDSKTTPRVGLVGLHPAVAQYNQIPTIDGYVVLYSLAYKHQIQAIIQSELNQNKFIKDYFEKWGSRCYLFDNEAIISGDGILKTQKCCTKSLDYDFVKLKQLKCGYIISAVEVQKPSVHLKLLSKVEDANWRVWIYKVL
ncbi:hypothetical protein Emtol_3154 [Emticicia oligotrophica DSM 17448]|uniref:DUF2079 domain-containing protein n=1 Tax=Emticicia oligotrophica (strain DSM 17448 / CIP 109782 / MTCC 6937 / GPTSA100-15) TaxID=929562 RepID=A0ABN4ARX2_EMTOG|nr:DUF6044 family protein [Emticicia oligotrophica]AFK04287.1 hypothetical protein Emtol_3154 [Emticicia oligotrophica DSM 17448]